MTATRVYKLTPTDAIAKTESTPRLIEASSQSQALGFVARRTWTATVATQIDLIELCGEQRVKVERATEE